MVRRISGIFPKWDFHGADFLSWLWIDVGTSEMAEKVVDVSRDSGFPIRHGMHGYGMPTFIRVAVRNPNHICDWFSVIEGIVDSEVADFINIGLLSNRLIIRNDTVPLRSIFGHERAIETRANALLAYIVETEFTVAIPSIIVSEVSHEGALVYVVIDGHHRLSVLMQLGYTNIPVSIVRYDDPIVVVHPNNDHITKDIVIQKSLLGDKMEPKSTQHTVVYNGIKIPLVHISNMFFPKKILK